MRFVHHRRRCALWEQQNTHRPAWFLARRTPDDGVEHHGCGCTESRCHAASESLKGSCLGLYSHASFFISNPFTATACKISGLKSAHIHSSRQYIWWSCNKSTFNTVQFDRNHLACSGEGGKKASMVSNLALLWVVFRMTAQQAW